MRYVIDVRYWHLADMGLLHCTCPLSEAKRTCHFAPQKMSTFDPKRTFGHLVPIPSSMARKLRFA